MQKTITTLIPQYGELNRICKDWIVSHTFSFEKQKFIVDFYSEWSDIKAFEQAILELVLHTPPEPCTLLLKSLKKEVKEYIRLYESYRLLHDEVIIRVCYQYADRYKETIKEEMEVVNRLRKPMNEANNRYDSIGYREHTPEEEKLAEREYERCKAEYEKEKAQLDHLYEQQTLLWKEARQYMKNRCDDIYLLSVHFMSILTKYVPDEESQPNEADRQSRTDSQPEAETTTTSATATTAGLPEYFSMKLISLIHEVCAGEQFEDITAPDFYACMNLHPCQYVLKIKPREKIRVCYLISLMREQLPGQDGPESFYPSGYAWHNRKPASRWIFRLSARECAGITGRYQRHRDDRNLIWHAPQKEYRHGVCNSCHGAECSLHRVQNFLPAYLPVSFFHCRFLRQFPSVSYP